MHNPGTTYKSYQPNFYSIDSWQCRGQSKMIQLLILSNSQSKQALTTASIKKSRPIARSKSPFRQEPSPRAKHYQLRKSKDRLILTEPLATCPRRYSANSSAAARIDSLSPCSPGTWIEMQSGISWCIAWPVILTTLVRMQVTTVRIMVRSSHL